MTQEFREQNVLQVDGRLLCRHYLWGRCIKVGSPAGWGWGLQQDVLSMCAAPAGRRLPAGARSGLQRPHQRAVQVLRAGHVHQRQGVPVHAPYPCSGSRLLLLRPPDLSFTPLHSLFPVSTSTGRGAARWDQAAGSPTSPSTSSPPGSSTRCVAPPSPRRPVRAAAELTFSLQALKRDELQQRARGEPSEEAHPVSSETGSGVGVVLQPLRWAQVLHLLSAQQLLSLHQLLRRLAISPVLSSTSGPAFIKAQTPAWPQERLESRQPRRSLLQARRSLLQVRRSLLQVKPPSPPAPPSQNPCVTRWRPCSDPSGPGRSPGLFQLQGRENSSLSTLLGVLQQTKAGFPTLARLFSALPRQQKMLTSVTGLHPSLAWKIQPASVTRSRLGAGPRRTAPGLV